MFIKNNKKRVNLQARYNSNLIGVYALYIFFLLLFLSGCASAQRDALTFDQVQLPQPNEELSVLVFHRLLTPPAASGMRVSINDKKIVALPNNTFSYIKLPAGNYDLKIS
ncbi:hypothetical protein I6E72_16190 [Pseudoalteromonas sp. NSLLW24]|uniref:hypothetical protein n=1 Tax=Pseudoalteromonas sp. NSLLW24 TaxID=2792050 RepID=UPI0018CFA8D3|nr:hypothetical protein [Pseudoalteromonas sp. NSLLW24]MBH0000496.1 hypothetical protein [Pseudoalteromonas sp. NSLLW24]